MEEVRDEPLYRDRVCGIDIGKAAMVATIRVPSDRDPARRAAETRSFGTTKREVLALADWLRCWQVPAVVMEATGDYWKGPFYRLEGCGPPDTADEELLRHCRGPVLDVGCGPGRLTVALSERGIPALGVDISRAAVVRVREAGAAAMHRSVFDPLPAQGRWATVLLADGNIGIGGLPACLLHRCAQMLAPGGRILIEAEPGNVDEQLTA